MGKLSGLQEYNQRRREEAQEEAEALRPILIELYVNRSLSQREVGEELGVDQTQVSRWLRRLHIPRRSRANFGEKNGRFKDGSQSRLYRKVIVKKECACCGTCDNLCIHHKNFDHYDNAPENLEVLCHGCHLGLHKRGYWQALRDGIEPEQSNGPIGWKRV